MLGGVTPAHGIGDDRLEYDESARVIPQIDDQNPNNPDSNNRKLNDPNEDDLKQANDLKPMYPNPNPINLNGNVGTLSRSKRLVIDLKTPVAKSGFVRPNNDDRKGQYEFLSFLRQILTLSVKQQIISERNILLHSNTNNSLGCYRESGI